MNQNLFACAFLGLLAASCGAPLPAVPQVTGDPACDATEIADDAALIRYGSCEVINGDLVVRGVGDLSPLARVRSISGSLWIRDTADLRSLSGLERLESLPLLMLTNNKSLGDLSALSQLHELGSLILLRNPELQSLEGMQGLRVLNHLTVINNGLVTLRGVENLGRVENITISRNAHLVDVGALNQLTEAEHVTVDHNPRITAQFGLFNGLASGHGEVNFRDNPALARSDIARFQWAEANDGVAAVH